MDYTLSWCKGLRTMFTRKINYYKISFWVICYETNSFWMQMNYGIIHKQNEFWTIKFSFGYYFMKQILSECKWCKVLFTRKIYFSTIQFSFECYMMKQILSLVKQILDYRIFIWVTLSGCKWLRALFTRKTNFWQ